MHCFTTAIGNIRTFSTASPECTQSGGVCIKGKRDQRMGSALEACVLAVQEKAEQSVMDACPLPCLSPSLSSAVKATSFPHQFYILSTPKQEVQETFLCHYLEIESDSSDCHNKPTVIMLGVAKPSLFTSAALYASCTSFAAFWVAFGLPFQHNTHGPYNYHRVIRHGSRIPWRRVPRL